MKKYLATIPFFRFFALFLLRKSNFKLKWVHDITNRPFYLETYKHKGYWYYGKNREKFEINCFYKLIKKGDKVLEVGAHIGYVTQVFEKIVGKLGEVLVVEPTPENIFYLTKNVSKSTKIISKAASDNTSEGLLYTTDFGGFTNSLNKELTLLKNKEQGALDYKSSKVKPLKVEIDTLDNICKIEKFSPNFLKIDVEGEELKVLKGSSNILKLVNGIMIEIRFDKKEIIELLEKYKFKICFEDENSNDYFFKKI